MNNLCWLGWTGACVAMLSAQCLEYFCSQHEIWYFIFVTSALAGLVAYAGIAGIVSEQAPRDSGVKKHKV